MKKKHDDLSKIAPGLKTLIAPIGRLKVDRKNARIHSDRNLGAIAASLEIYGQQKPIVATKDGTVVAGNGTLIAARKLGWKNIAVATTTLDKVHAKAYAIADNWTGDTSSWDGGQLDKAYRELKEGGHDLGDMLGFTERDLAKLTLDFDSVDETPEPEPTAPAAEPVNPRVGPGDIWSLGHHVVVCGDSTKQEIYENILKSTQRASLIFTDPPYGVKYTTDKHRPIANDEKQNDQLELFLTLALKQMAAHAHDHAAFYVWHASATRDAFAGALARAGLVELQQIIWIKASFVLGHADYQWAHEPCFYAAMQGKRPKFYGDRAQRTVWRFGTATPTKIAALVGPGVSLTTGGGTIHITAAPPKGKRVRRIRLDQKQSVVLQGHETDTTAWEVKRDTAPEHPTQKSVELALRAIENSSQPGEIVLDPFLGSGGTLIACERSGRVCRAIELDPVYVRVAIERWERITGKKAVRVSK